MIQRAQDELDPGPSASTRPPAAPAFPSMDELRSWVIKPQAVTRCTAGDVYRMRAVVSSEEAGIGAGGGAAGSGRAGRYARDVFMLDKWPCRLVELVGWVAGVDQKETSVTVYLDSGEPSTPVLPLTVRLTPIVVRPPKSSEPTAASPSRHFRPSFLQKGAVKVYPRPDIRAGDTVRVRGRIEDWYRRSTHAVASGPGAAGEWVRTVNVEEGTGGWIRVVHPEEEHEHVTLVQRLRTEVYSQALDLEAAAAAAAAAGVPETKVREKDEDTDPRTPRKRKKSGLWEPVHDWTRSCAAMRTAEPSVQWSSPAKSVISETSTIHSFQHETYETITASPSPSCSTIASPTGHGQTSAAARDRTARPRLRDPASLPSSLLTDVTFRRYLLDWMVGTLEDALGRVEATEGREGVDTVLGELLPEFKGLMADLGVASSGSKSSGVLGGISTASGLGRTTTLDEEGSGDLARPRISMSSRERISSNQRALSETGRENTSSRSLRSDPSMITDVGPQTPTKSDRRNKSRRDHMEDMQATLTRTSRSKEALRRHRTEDADIKSEVASQRSGTRRTFRSQQERLKDAARRSQSQTVPPLPEVASTKEEAVDVTQEPAEVPKRTFRSRAERLRDAQQPVIHPAPAPMEQAGAQERSLDHSSDEGQASDGEVLPIPFFTWSAISALPYLADDKSAPSRQFAFPPPSTARFTLNPAHPPPSLRHLSTLVIHRSARTEERRRLRRIAAGTPRAADLEVEERREAEGRKRGDYRLDRTEVDRRRERLGRWALREIGKEGGVVDLPVLDVGSPSLYPSFRTESHVAAPEPALLPLTPALLAPVTHYLLLKLYRQSVIRRSQVYRRKDEPLDPSVHERQVARALSEWGDGRWERAGGWGVREGLGRAEERGWVRKVGKGEGQGWVPVDLEEG